MARRRKIFALVIGGLALLYAGTAAFMLHALPSPHQPFEYMVVGSGCAGVTMFAVFAGYVLRGRI